MTAFGQVRSLKPTVGYGRYFAAGFFNIMVILLCFSNFWKPGRGAKAADVGYS
jgi:hypothetical protein